MLSTIGLLSEVKRLREAKNEKGDFKRWKGLVIAEFNLGGLGVLQVQQSLDFSRQDQ